MPTPSETAISALPPELSHEHGNRPSCPPDSLRSRESTSLPERIPTNNVGVPVDERGDGHSGSVVDQTDDTSTWTVAEAEQAPTASDKNEIGSNVEPNLHSSLKRLDSEDDAVPRDMPSPMSTTDDNTADTEQQRPAESIKSQTSTTLEQYLLLNSPFPSQRYLPNSSSSFLRPGSRFRGTQQSDRQIYEVQVDLKHVDMEESFLCGYLRIQGLTDDHPTLTTYFEGEIVGNKYTFQTRHPEWGSNEKVDMQHWGRFPAWRPLAKQAKRPDFSFKNYAQRENIFMRWKEYFLVPNHRVRTISGASFEGYYYICFNQTQGSISGIYFHAKSEKYQQLELQHVQDHGCMGAMEFR